MATMNLLEEYYNAHDASVEPATIDVIADDEKVGENREE